MLPSIEQQVTVNETTCPYTYSVLSAIPSGRHRADLIKMVLELHFRSQAANNDNDNSRPTSMAPIQALLQDTQSTTTTVELGIDDDEFGQAFSSFFQ